MTTPAKQTSAQFAPLGTVNAPADWNIPTNIVLSPSIVFAHFDGTAAAGSFVPTLQILSDSGHVVAEIPQDVTVAAGSSCEATWAPFLKSAAQATAAGTSPPGTGGTLWLTGGYKGAVYAPGSLLAYYRLGAAPNTLIDQVTNPAAVNLIKHSGAVSGSSVTGPPQIADGNDAYNLAALATQDGDYFVIPSGANKFANITADWSLSLWVWPSSAQPGLNSFPSRLNQAGIFWDRNDQGSSNLAGWALQADYDSGAGYGGVNVGLGLVPSGQDTYAIGPVTLTAGGDPAKAASWYHVAISHSLGANTTRLYVNGALVGSYIGLGFDWYQSPGGGSIFLGGYGLGVGFPSNFSSTNQQRGFVGTIDEVAVFTKVLSQSDVLLLYDGSGLDSDTGRWISTGYGAGAPVGTGAIDTAQLADQAVTTAKIADSAVTSAKIADGTIVAADISATLKPSGSAGAGVEALRALGTTASTATAGNDARLFASVALAYSASITPNTASGLWQTITVTTATAFTINAPTNPPAATATQELVIEIFNNSGGAMGAVTWNAAFVLTGGAFTNPATGKRRYIAFQWNGANWIEQNRAAADY